MINRTIKQIVEDFIIISLIFTFASAAMAATYYVKPTGDDTKDGLSEANAWKHVQKACATLVAGDTVLIRYGDYSENSPDVVPLSESFTVNAGLRPAHSGTSYAVDNQIVFKAYPGDARPIIRGIAATGSGTGGRVAAFLDGRSYITYDSLYFHYGWWGIMPWASKCITIKNCKIDSISSSYDNVAGVGNCLEGGSARADWPDSIWVENCDIGYIGQNGAFGGEGQFGGIELYPGFCFWFRNNNIHHTYTAIYLKGGNPHSTGSGWPVEISGNILHDCYENGIRLGNGGKWHTTLIFNNVFYNNGSNAIGIAFPSNTDTAHCAVNTFIYNNTFDLGGTQSGIRSQNSDFDSTWIFNNIFYNPKYNAGGYEAAFGIKNEGDNPSNFWENFNLLYGRSDHYYYVWPSGTSYTLTAWKSASPSASHTPGVLSGGHGSNNIEQDPLFVNAGNHDYHLQAGSPALTAGRGGSWPGYIGAFGTIDTTLAIGDASAVEGDLLRFIMGLTCPAPVAVTYNYTTINGTASAPANYTALSGTGIINAGQSADTILVTTIDDAITNSTRTMSLSISSPSRYTISRSNGVGSIFDNDAAPLPTVSLSANPTAFPAGGGITTLSWISTNADSVVIVIQGSGQRVTGSGPANGSTSTALTATTNYVATAYKLPNTDSSQVTVYVATVRIKFEQLPNHSIAVSGTYSGYTINPIADAIVDPYGGTQSTWASDQSTLVPHWVEADFGRPVDICGLTIYWAWNSARSSWTTSRQYAIQGWNGSSFIDLATVNNTSALDSTQTTFANYSTQRIRIYQPANQGPADYSSILWLTEVSFWSQDTTPPARIIDFR